MEVKYFKLDLVMTSVIILGIVAGIMYLAVLLLEKFIVKSRKLNKIHTFLLVNIKYIK